WPGAAPAPRWIPAPPLAAMVPPPAFPPETRELAVRPGDTLPRVITRGGLEPRMANDLATQFGRNGAELRKLRPGAVVRIVWNFRKEPIEVRYEASPWLSFAARPVNGAWRVGRAETVPDLRVETVSGVVQRSLFDAVERTGESARLVLELVDMFSSDFDFTADTRAGDRFRLLVEKRYAGDAFVDYGRILVAQYASGGRILTGVGFERASRYGHYDTSGQSLRKSFLRSPLEFTRITSGFTYARPHPILGGVRPHLAIDYGAPAGTPVRAVTVPPGGALPLTSRPFPRVGGRPRNFGGLGPDGTMTTPSGAVRAAGRRGAGPRRPRRRLHKRSSVEPVVRLIPLGGLGEIGLN